MNAEPHSPVQFPKPIMASASPPPPPRITSHAQVDFISNSTGLCNAYSSVPPLPEPLRRLAPDGACSPDASLSVLVKPWPLREVLQCLSNNIVSTNSQHLFVLYSVDDHARRHTEVQCGLSVWEHLKVLNAKRTQWRLALYADVPPERNFTLNELLQAARGKGVASRTAKAIEVANTHHLDWFLAKNSVDPDDDEFMPEVVDVLRVLALVVAAPDARSVERLRRHLIESSTVARAAVSVNECARLAQRLAKLAPGRRYHAAMAARGGGSEDYGEVE